MIALSKNPVVLTLILVVSVYIPVMINNDDDIIEYPIDGILDLHTFSPREIKDLVPDYIEACLESEIYQIRIIHGKGTGTLRTIVYSILNTNPHVDSYKLDSGSSSWGATLVNLKKKEAPDG